MAYTKKTYPLILRHVNVSAAPSPPVSVLVAYPKDLTGRLIAEALSRDGNFQVAAHVSSSRAVMTFAQHSRIHVALIGASLGTPNDGVDIIRQLNSLQSHSLAILLIDTPDPQVTLDAFRAGAKGVFCMSHHGYEVLRECIRCVFEGQIWSTSQSRDAGLRFGRPF